MNILVKFKWDCGRGGYVSSVFICTEQELDQLFNKELYFGEILGKHSEIYGTADADDFKVLSNDQDFINKCLEIFGDKTISGHNPLHYVRDEE